VEARLDVDIETGEKLIVFGDPIRAVVNIFKSEIMARFADMLLRKASLH